ncbi:MAG: hypothetical protein WCC26_07315 [Terracidiphilus sp.]
MEDQSENSISINQGRIEDSAVARSVAGAGRGALVEAMFGAGWLGWGLGEAKAFNGVTGPTFGCLTLLLLACSIYILRRGRLLRKKYPEVGASGRTTLKWYLVVVLVEILGILLVMGLANRLHRPDLAADWCAMVVGLHFLLLAKIFRAPHLVVLGILMTLWCALCWAIFRSNALVISASMGTGVLLWGSCIFTLLRARKIVQSIHVRSVAV